jgi:hypothetical protein
MMRGRGWSGLAVAAAASIGTGCPGRGDTTAAHQPARASQTDAPQTDAPQTDAPQTDAPLCLPKSSCGCFGGECVAGRLEPRDELGNRVAIEGETQDGVIGLLFEVCPDASNDLTECVQTIDVSLTCTVVCSDPPDRFADPGYRCGFRNGVCGKL